MSIKARFPHYLLPLLILLLAGCRPAGGVWPQIQASGVLRVGLDPTYPPFESTEGGELHGFDVDLAHALASDLGLTAEFVHLGYDGLYDALATGRVDVLLSALVIQPERTRDFAYSEPYFNAGQLLLLPAGSAVRSVADLPGRVVAVELGAEGHVLATEYTRRLPNLTITPYNTPDEALAAVAAGAADAAITDAISAYLYLAATHDEGQLHPAGEPLTTEPFALVVRIEDEQLLDQLNQSLARLQAGGQLATMRTRWLESPANRPN